MQLGDIKNFITEIFLFKNIYWIYVIIGLCIILSIIFIIKKSLERKRKADLYFYYFDPVSNQHIIDTVINIFSYGFIHNKQIGIMLTNKFEINKIVEYTFKAQFNYHNLKFFLQGADSFTIFMNITGIIYGITVHKIDMQNILISHSYLLITSQLENQKYTLHLQGQILKDKDIYHVQMILKKFLQCNYSL